MPPRGMIAAPPMPQYGMPMNGQMPPHPPMMPPMPPMPPQPPQQQQGAQPQSQQADPWAGGINPSLTALLPQGGAPGYTPAPYTPPTLAGWSQPAPAPAPPFEVNPAPAYIPAAAPAPAPAQQAPAPSEAAPAPVQQAAATPQPEPSPPPIQPTPIATAGWAWPPPTVGVPIEPGALAGVAAPPVSPVAELQELIPAEATLTPWRQERQGLPPPAPAGWPAIPPARPVHQVDPWGQVDWAPAPAVQTGLSPWRPVESGLAQEAPPAPAPPPEPQPHENTPAPPILQQAEATEPEPIPYYPTLAPAVPQPVTPLDPPEPAPGFEGTYSTRSGRYARKIL